MFWNNAVLLSWWAVMCWTCGAALFFPIYLVTVSLAGGAGIVLFTVQHNFEHAYASDTADWDYDTGAISGTSFLILPEFLNFFTANIGYHHIHHLSPRIPNYCLVDCHNTYPHLFTEVRTIALVGRAEFPEVHSLGQPRATDHHGGGVPRHGDSTGLTRPVEPVTRVTQPRQNVPVIVQLRIDRRRPNPDLGVMGVQLCETRLGGEQTDKT